MFSCGGDGSSCAVPGRALGVELQQEFRRRLKEDQRQSGLTKAAFDRLSQSLGFYDACSWLLEAPVFDKTTPDGRCLDSDELRSIVPEGQTALSPTTRLWTLR